MLSRIALLIVLTSSFISNAFTTVVKNKLDIEKSVDGQPVQMRIVISTDSPSYVGFPKTPPLNDWTILSKNEISDVRTFEKNGRLVRKNIKYFIYVLKPLRSGKVAIPSFEIKVGKKSFKTSPLYAQVEAFDQNKGPKISNPFPKIPDTQNDDFDNQDLGLGTNDLDTTKKISFLAETDKKEAFVGEMIKVSFNLYRRNIQDINHDYKKFPVFEGFLKEDLFLPRALPRRTVSVNGVPYQKTEFARFALFPLKEGLLSIDPFQIRYELLPLGNFGFQTGRKTIPQSISSKPVKIFAKPLPAVPKDIKFSGTVGDYDWKITPPPSTVPANQPFTLSIEISGTGNIKAIEAPHIEIPTGVERHGVKPFPNVNKEAQGSIKFDYLFVPRTAGKIEFPEIEWGFFNPEKKEYISLKHDPILLNVDGNNIISENDSSDKEVKKHVFKPIQVSNQSFRDIKASTSYVNKFTWIILWVLYVTLGVLFFIRKQKIKHDSHAKANPWKKTEHHILKKRTRPESRLAGLIDQYMREYITGLISDSSIHSKSTNDEIILVLSQKTPPEYHKNIQMLKSFFRELDQTRFSGKKTVKANCKKQLEQAKSILAKVEKHLG